MTYLFDKAFLKSLDEEPYREKFVRISVLNFHTEQPIGRLEGKATGGTINLNGNSAMRRALTCSLIVDPEGVFLPGYNEYQSYNDITNIKNYISMNKKVKVEVGFYNTTNQYTEYDILWFPLGIYVIKAASISSNNGGVSISLTLNDKAALLNGDMGGVIPAATVFSEAEFFNPDGTKKDEQPVLIKDMIKHLVVNFGGENPNNVIITGVPDTAIKLLKWAGVGTLYLLQVNGELYYSLEKKEGVRAEKEYAYGDDIGYMNEPFVYPGTLECNAGETVASLLDKLKNTLGNFEWFYDVEGHFRFQEIKNYLNSSNVTDIINLTEKDYLSYFNLSKSVYTFDNKKIITTISNAPQYGNIKNDYLVWGTTKSVSGIEKPIRYHIAFDTKPRVSDVERKCLVYMDEINQQQVMIIDNNPNVQEVNEITSDTFTDKQTYYICKRTSQEKESTPLSHVVVHWDEDLQCYRVLENWECCYLMTTHWRTELYFLGLENSNLSFANNYYAAELKAEWPKIYNVRAEKQNYTIDGYNVYKGDYWDKPVSSYEYWLEFLEGSDGEGSPNISQFNVNNIGRRSKVVTDKSVNCLFPFQPTTYAIIEVDGDTAQDRGQAEMKGQNWIQMPSSIFKNCLMKTSQYSAFEKLKELLIIHTQYNESITLNVIPIYYLEPNTRITVYDKETCIYGDYMIKSITLPLTSNGTSTINATRCLEKTI